MSDATIVAVATLLAATLEISSGRYYKAGREENEERLRNS